MQIVENFLDDVYADELESIFVSNNFPIYYTNDTVRYDIDGAYRSNLTKNEPQFIHVFFNDLKINSDFFVLVRPLLLKINELIGLNYNLLNCKLNLNVQSNDFGKENYYAPHVDFTQKDCITAIYYVIDSDGDTLFFDDNFNITDRVNPKKNKLVIFDTAIIHAGQAPSTYKTRMLLNINFKKQTDKS